MAEPKYISHPLDQVDLSTHPDTMQITLRWKDKMMFSLIAPTDYTHQQQIVAIKSLKAMIRKLENDDPNNPQERSNI